MTISIREFITKANMWPTTHEMSSLAGPVISRLILNQLPDTQIPFGSVRQASHSDIVAASNADPTNVFLRAAAEPELFATLSQLDGGGTPDASLPQNWTLLDIAATAGATGIISQRFKVTGQDLRHWANLDGHSGISHEDIRLLRELAENDGITSS
jgi:hypothetical protein